MKVHPSVDKIPQKWDAAAHEVASFINNNTDVIILTVFLPLEEISVYTIYHYVISNLKKIVTRFTVGFSAAFGDMYARNEIEAMHKNLSIFELIIFSFTSILYSVTFVMMIPFVYVYTSGITDADYIRSVFSLLMILGGIFNCFRVPYRAITIAAGHYKQTRNGAIMEAIINISVSVAGVILFGLSGVALGTLCAMVFRTMQYVIYLSNNIMYRDISYFIKHALICFAVMAAVHLISRLYMPILFNGWKMWIMYAFITTILAIVLTLITNMVFYREDMANTVQKILGLFKRHQKKERDA